MHVFLETVHSIRTDSPFQQQMAFVCALGPLVMSAHSVWRISEVRNRFNHYHRQMYRQLISLSGRKVPCSSFLFFSLAVFLQQLAQPIES